MIPAISASKIYSTLGNENSLIPLAIKDIANSTGLTAASYLAGDEAEGRDRFIDEFGTQAIWLFGIPVYKKLLDLGLFKTLGFDPKVDVRVLKNPDIFEKAKEYAANDKIKASLEKIGKSQKNIKIFKGLTFGKFVASTFLTIASYYGLTKFRHKHTEEHIKEEFLKKQAALKTTPHKIKPAFAAPSLQKVPSAFGGVHNSTKTAQKQDKNPSFGGIQDFMFSPTKNLMIVDGSITAERIFESRNPQDTIGYIVKEGSFWAFMYLLGGRIQKHVENSTEKKHNMNIKLDARVIESEELKNALKNKDLPTLLQAFSNLKKDVDIYDFICNPNNKDNIIVKMAKMSDIIKVTPTPAKDTDRTFAKLKNTILQPKDLNNPVDTRAFIDIDAVKSINENLGKLYEQFSAYKANAGTGKQDEELLTFFLKDLKKYKRISILKNIGACIGALGIVCPAIMLALRFINKDNRNFKVKEDIEQKLAADIQAGKIKV